MRKKWERKLTADCLWPDLFFINARNQFQLNCACLLIPHTDQCVSLPSWLISDCSPWDACPGIYKYATCPSCALQPAMLTSTDHAISTIGSFTTSLSQQLFPCQQRLVDSLSLRVRCLSFCVEFLLDVFFIKCSSFFRGYHRLPHVP